MGKIPSPAGGEAPTGWRAWRGVLAALVAVPVLLGVSWALAAGIAWMIPGCRVGPSDGSCTVGGVDLGALLAVMAMPAIIFSLAAPFWLALIAAWTLYGLVPAGLWWLSGRGFVLHEGFMLKGSAMRVPRLVAGTALALLYVWYLAGTV